MIYVFIPILTILFGVIVFFLYIILTEYKPQPIEDSVLIRNSRDQTLNDKISITTLNMGYCSLDKDQDFFLEGGKNAKTSSRDHTFDNLISLANTLKDFKSDFYFLQEVDTHGSRSANINQVEHLTSEFNQYNLFFAYNYRAKWVPIPITHPMGSAHSGLVTLSKKQVISSERIQLQGQETFPKSLFFPKRCMVVSKVKVKRDKDLYLINIHLSAYDKDSMFRTQQIHHILNYIKELYEKEHNYIIVGGDFNLLLDEAMYHPDLPDWVSKLPKEVYESKFKIAFDSKTNTVRSDDMPYVKGRNFETVIDGFLVSPNINIVSVKTHDLGYKHTDHNPVTLFFDLK